MNMDIYSPSHPTDDLESENEICEDNQKALKSQKERDAFEGVFKEIVSQMSETKKHDNDGDNNIHEERSQSNERESSIGSKCRDDYSEHQNRSERGMSPDPKWRKGDSRESRRRLTSCDRRSNDKRSRSRNMSGKTDTRYSVDSNISFDKIQYGGIISPSSATSSRGERSLLGSFPSNLSMFQNKARTYGGKLNYDHSGRVLCRGFQSDSQWIKSFKGFASNDSRNQIFEDIIGHEEEQHESMNEIVDNGHTCLNNEFGKNRNEVFVSRNIVPYSGENLKGIKVNKKIFPFVNTFIDPVKKDMEYKKWDMQTSLSNVSVKSQVYSRNDDFHKPLSKCSAYSNVGDDSESEFVTREDVLNRRITYAPEEMITNRFDSEFSNMENMQSPVFNDFSIANITEEYSGEEFDARQGDKHMRSSRTFNDFSGEVNKCLLDPRPQFQNKISFNNNNSDFRQRHYGPQNVNSTFQSSSTCTEYYNDYENNNFKRKLNNNSFYSADIMSQQLSPQYHFKQAHLDVQEYSENEFPSREVSERSIRDRFVNDFDEEINNWETRSKVSIQYPIINSDTNNISINNTFEDKSDEEFCGFRDDRNNYTPRISNEFPPEGNQNNIPHEFGKRHLFPIINNFNTGDLGPRTCSPQQFQNNRFQRSPNHLESFNNYENNNISRNYKHNFNPDSLQLSDVMPHHLQSQFHYDDLQSNDRENCKVGFSPRRVIERMNLENVSETQAQNKFRNDFDEEFDNWNNLPQVMMKSPLFEDNIKKVSSENIPIGKFCNEFDIRRDMQNMRNDEVNQTNITRVYGHRVPIQDRGNFNNNSHFEPRICVPQSFHNSKFQRPATHDESFENFENNSFTDNCNVNFSNPSSYSTNDISHQSIPRFNYNNSQSNSQVNFESETASFKEVQRMSVSNVSETMIPDRYMNDFNENGIKIRESQFFNNDSNTSSNVNIPEVTSDDDFGAWGDEQKAPTSNISNDVSSNMKQDNIPCQPEERPPNINNFNGNNNFEPIICGPQTFNNTRFERPQVHNQVFNNYQINNMSDNSNPPLHSSYAMPQQLRPQFNYDQSQWSGHPQRMANTIYPPTENVHPPFPPPFGMISRLQHPMMPQMAFIPPPPPPPPPPSTSYETRIPPLPPAPIIEESDSTTHDQESNKDQSLNNIVQSLSKKDNKNLLETLMTQAGLSSDTLRFSHEGKQDTLSASFGDTFSTILKSAATSVISRLVESSIKPPPVSDNMSMSPPSPPASPSIQLPRKSQTGFDMLPLLNYSDALNPNKTPEVSCKSSDNLLDKDKQILRSYYECKNDWQERIALEVKTFLKPAFVSKSIDKNDYKVIMKRCVTKITKSGVTEINQSKIEKFVLSYVDKYNKNRKTGQHSAVSSSGHAV